MDLSLPFLDVSFGTHGIVVRGINFSNTCFQSIPQQSRQNGLYGLRVHTFRGSEVGTPRQLTFGSNDVDRAWRSNAQLDAIVSGFKNFDFNAVGDDEPFPGPAANY
jgi:hypothetical protein